MADEEVQEVRDRPPGWYPAGASPNEQVHWDGQHWTARRRWVRSAWIDVPMEADEARRPLSSNFPSGEPPAKKHGRRWSPTTVVLLVVALLGLGGIVFAVVRGVNSAPTPKSTSATTAPASPPLSTTSTTTGVSIQQGSEAEVAACQADAKSVEVALAAFQAQQGHYPAPSSPWSAATYANNYLPLTSVSGGGPYLHGAPTTTRYVVEYDSSGHVWITPPGAYDAYDAGQDFDTNPSVCLAAVG